MKTKYVLILILLGFVIYFNSFFNGFVWDDEEQIVNNVLIHSIWNLPKFFFGGAFNSGGTGSLLGVYYKPLMTTVFSLIYSIFGSGPFFFHFFSLVIHVANTVLVFFLFKEFFAVFVAFAVALLFLIHPLYSEVVLYTSNMQDLLYFFFGTAAFVLLIKKNIDFKRALLIFFLFLSSLLSKETGLVLILLSILYVFLFKKKKESVFWTSLAGAASIVIYSVMRFKVAGIFLSGNEMAPIARLTLVQRLINIPKIISYYLQNFFVPFNLSVNQHWVVKSLSVRDFYLPLIFSLVFFAVMLFIVFWLRRTKNSASRLYFFFFCWFVLSLFLHIQIFPLDVTVTGRWFYLPAVGLMGMMAVLAPQKRMASIVVLLIIVGLALRTFIRTFDWRDGLTLYSREIRLSEDNFNLENNLGVELYRIGKIEEARGHFERSVDLAPYWWTNYNNLGAYWERKNDLFKAEGLYLKAIENGNYYLAYENYALVLLKQKKNNKAKEFLEENISYFPQNPKLMTFLALSYYLIGDKDNAVEIMQHLTAALPTDQNKLLLQAFERGEDLDRIFE